MGQKTKQVVATDGKVVTFWKLAPQGDREDYVRELEGQLLMLGCPAPRHEWVFARPRRWRFDLAYPDRKIAIEVEGGVFSQGRHTRGQGYTGDIVKYNEAALLGWLLIRCTPSQIRSGVATKWVIRALTARPLTIP